MKGYRPIVSIMFVHYTYLVAFCVFSMSGLSSHTVYEMFKMMLLPTIFIFFYLFFICFFYFQTGYSFGFGFINYVNEESALRAIKCLNGYTIRNKRIKVSFARPPGEEIKETNLYITNLPRNITEEWLDTIFGKYGTIVQKNILRDKLSGSPRGVAFVR